VARRRTAQQGIGGDLSSLGWRFYGVTTADQPRRQRYLEREFSRHGIDAAIHVAQRPTEADGFPSAGYRGCFESHLFCLRAARDDGARVAVVAEDDLMLMTEFDRRAVAIDRWLAGRTWSVLFLGYLEGQSPAWHEPVESVGPNVVAAAGWHVQGSHCYAVHRDALDAVIADFESRLVPGGHKISTDGVLSEFHRDNDMRPLLCVPNLAHQTTRLSGISPGQRSLKTRILAVPAAADAIGALKRLQRERRSRRPHSATVQEWNLRAARRSVP
jgi:GR25 family glycosyltransferase involved in LPS biosynthesis